MRCFSAPTPTSTASSSGRDRHLRSADTALRRSLTAHARDHPDAASANATTAAIGNRAFIQRPRMSQGRPGARQPSDQRDAGHACCILRCMSATRTQIYLQPSQRRRLDEIAGSQGTSLAAVVREAVELYIAQAPVDPTTALESTFGAAPGATFPGRDEWEGEPVTESSRVIPVANLLVDTDVFIDHLRGARDLTRSADIASTTRSARRAALRWRRVGLGAAPRSLRELAVDRRPVERGGRFARNGRRPRRAHRGDRHRARPGGRHPQPQALRAGEAATAARPRPIPTRSAVRAVHRATNVAYSSGSR